MFDMKRRSKRIKKDENLRMRGRHTTGKVGARLQRVPDMRGKDDTR